jgi:hypothetical protein
METSTQLDTSTEPNLKPVPTGYRWQLLQLSETRLSDTLP